MCGSHRVFERRQRSAAVTVCACVCCRLLVLTQACTHTHARPLRRQFTHHRSISSRDTVGDYDMALTQPVTRAGFQGLWATGPRAGGLGAQATQFRPPCYMQHKIDASATRGWESMVVVYAGARTRACACCCTTGSVCARMHVCSAANTCNEMLTLPPAACCAVPVAPGQCRLLNRNAFRRAARLCCAPAAVAQLHAAACGGELTLRSAPRCCCRFTGKGLAAKLPAALMARVPRWAIHLGTQVRAHHAKHDAAAAQTAHADMHALHQRTAARTCNSCAAAVAVARCRWRTTKYSCTLARQSTWRRASSTRVQLRRFTCRRG